MLKAALIRGAELNSLPCGGLLEELTPPVLPENYISQVPLPRGVWQMGGTDGRRLREQEESEYFSSFLLQTKLPALASFLKKKKKILVYAISAPGGQPHALCSQFLWSGPCHRPNSHPVAFVFGSGNAASCVPPALEVVVASCSCCSLSCLTILHLASILVSSSITYGTNSLLLHCSCLKRVRWCLCC